jgi:carbon-monoxide dehydrogenase medium subunit
MYPRAVAYERPGSLEDALQALAGDPGARVLAGGQSLVPMLALGLVGPSLLVDVNDLDLAGIEDRGATVAIGALTRHRELVQGAAARRLLPLAAEAAASVGSPRVRNRGTFGGSLAHADPVAELAAVAVAYGGHVVLAGPAGRRQVPIEEFFLGWYETAMGPGEMVVEVELVRPPDGAGSAFVEVAERADSYALAGAAAIVALAPDGATIDTARVVVIGGGAGVAVRSTAAESACAGSAPGPLLEAAVAAAVEASVDPEDDPFVPAHHRRRVAAACAARAVRKAAARALEGSR